MADVNVTELLARAEAERRYTETVVGTTCLSSRALHDRKVFIDGYLAALAGSGEQSGGYRCYCRHDYHDTDCPEGWPEEDRPAPVVRERDATPDEAHDIGYAKGHTDGYREAMAECAPVVPDSGAGEKRGMADSPDGLRERVWNALDGLGDLARAQYTSAVRAVVCPTVTETEWGVQMSSPDVVHPTDTEEQAREWVAVMGEQYVVLRREVTPWTAVAHPDG